MPCIYIFALRDSALYLNIELACPHYTLRFVADNTNLILLTYYQVIKFATDQQQDLRKLEKLSLPLFESMSAGFE